MFVYTQHVSLKIRVFYYESIKGELNKRLKFDSRCDARLKAEAEGCTRLTYTKMIGEPEFCLFIMNR